MPSLVKEGPQLTWSVVIAAVGAFCVLAGGGYTIVQNQFDFVRRSGDAAAENLAKQIELSRHEIELLRSQFLTLREHVAYQQEQNAVNFAVTARLNAMETAQRELIAHAARNPIEAREMDQLSASFDKQIAALRSQIDDINHAYPVITHDR